MRNAFYLLLITPLLLNCSGSNQSGGQNQPLNIKGTWTVSKIVCCGRNAATTYGGSREISFNTKKGTYKIYEYGKLEDSGTYTLTKDERIGDMIRLGEKFPANIYLKGNELVLDWGYMDLATETYTR